MKNEEMLQHIVTSMAKGAAYDLQVEASLTAQATAAKTRIEELATELEEWKKIVTARDAKILLLEADVAELTKKLEAAERAEEGRDDAEKELVSQLTAPGDDA